MTSVDKPAATTPEQPTQPENTKRGVLFALAAPVVGIVLWILLWRGGWMASIVSFAIAWLAICLYKKGSGGAMSRKAAYIVSGIVIGGIILAFFGGLISDGTSYYKEDAGMSEWELLQNSQFWDIMGENFTMGEYWSAYKGDIALAVVFAALGMYSTVRELFVKPATDDKK